MAGGGQWVMVEGSRWWWVVGDAVWWMVVVGEGGWWQVVVCLSGMRSQTGNFCRS